jgi:hypothetical protein
MKKLWKVVGIVTLVAILGAVGLSAVAYAQDEDVASPFDFVGRFKDALAGILGISVDEYDAAVEQAQGQVVDEAVADGWLTEEQAELMAWRMAQAPDSGMRGMDLGFGRLAMEHGIGGMGDNLVSVAADQLGLSLTELLTELQAGKSIAEVAEEKGVDTQTIIDAYVAELKADLDEAVADGDMTQTQADYALEQAQVRVVDQLDEAGLGRLGGHGRGRHGGMMGLPGPGGW